jgi:hypothetical protein
MMKRLTLNGKGGKRNEGKRSDQRRNGVRINKAWW